MENFIGQRGKARNGQVGVVVEVFTNALVFQSDTGARFTLLTCEFAPEREGTRERAVRVLQAAGLFANVGARDGFHYVRRVFKGAVEHIVHILPAYRVPQESTEQTEERLVRARNDITNGVRYN